MSVQARKPATEGWESWVFVGATVAVVSAALVWLAGEAAALLTSGRMLHVSPSEMVEVLTRLVTDPSDPAGAWPRPVRRFAASAPIFYPVLATLLVISGALAVAGRRFFGSEGSTPRRSGWASRRDLLPLIVASASRGRLVVGRDNGRLVAAEPRQSVIVLGPTQSMKTSGLAIPAILEWDGPVIATSVKTDLIRNTITARRRRGPVWVYDPTRCCGEEMARWSPLQHCHDWHGAQRVAMWLATAARSDGNGLANSDFWFAAAAKLLAPLLFAAGASGRSMADVVRWVNTYEEAEVLEALTAAGVQPAIDAATASFKREGRQRSSVYTTAETVLAAYEDPVVADSAAGSDIDPVQFFDGSSGTLFVVAPSHEQQRLRPLFEALLHSLLTHALEIAARNGPLDPPLLVVLDEAANIAPLRNLDSLASTAAGHGIQLVSVFQDLAQIASRYGDRAQTVVNNHRAKVVLSGISDTMTLEYASRLLGDEEVMQSSITQSARGGRSTTESPAVRSLAPAHALRGIKPGEGVLVYGHLPPARLRLRPWFADKSLRRLAGP